jgi:midasin
MDTSVEKASLYLGNEDWNSKSSAVVLTSLAECLPDWPEVVTGQDNSVGNYARYV